jgi:Uma2 family endonuclease
MPTTTISMQEYLESSNFHPDVEYIDGMLRERPVVQPVHGLLQLLIGKWFLDHRAEWDVKAAVEVRTRVSATRVRLPDVVVGPRRAWPPVLVEPPLIVIEILSPSDSYTETRKLAREYIEMGVENIWLIDPETRVSEFYRAGAWVPAQRLEVAGSAIYLDMDVIFAQLDEDNQRQGS